MLARIPDQPDIFLLARILEGAEHLVQQHVREADDGVQRRAQFMAHHRQEPALGHFRGGCRLIGLREFLTQPGSFVILAQDEREDVAPAPRRAAVRAGTADNCRPSSDCHFGDYHSGRCRSGAA